MALTRITKGVIKPNEDYQTGIITATGLDVNGNADISGSLSVSGVLTYEDVTSIDSVGIITARTGVVSPYADIDDFLDVGSNIKLGNAGVITATSFVGSGAALTGIDATAIKDSGGNVKVQAQASGAVYTGIHTFNSGAEVGSNIKLGNAGVVTATSFTGSGANLTSLPAQATIANNADNRVITGGSGVNLNGEANLTFDGNDLTVTGTAPAINFIDTDADDYKIHNVQGVLKITDTTASADRFVINDNGTGYFINNFQIGSTTSSPGATLHIKTSYPSLKVDSGGHASDAYVRIISGNAQNSRVDFGDSDDDDIGMIDYDHSNNSMRFLTNTSERLRITSSGQVCIGTDTAVRALTIKQPGQIHLESTDTGNWLGVSLKGSSGTNNYNAYFGMLDSNGNFFIDNGSNGNDFVIAQSGQVTIGGELHIGSKLVHDGDTDTHINFSSNTMVVTAGNVTKMNINNTMVEINGVTQREGGRQYSTNSNSTWTNILSFSNASTNGFSFECGVSENNYTTMYKVGGSPNYNSCYFTSDDAGDSNHAHSSDITFRILNDSGTKRLQFKAVSYTTTRYLIAISVWVRSGYVNWS